MIMQIRRSIILFVILILTLTALGLWLVKRKSEGTSPTAKVETNAVSSATTAATQKSLASLPTQTNAQPANPARNTAASNPVQAPAQSKWERMKSILASQNDVPIVFYGRLEDQFSNPIADAEIDGSVRIDNGVEHTVKRFTLSSDAGGFFTVSGYKGQDLSVIPHKAGYVLASRNGGGIYSHMWPESQRVHPDPNNPVIIKMWKLQGAEPLASINQHYKLRYTDKPIRFDLVAKKIVQSGGDVKITIKRPPGEISERHRQDWGFKIEAVNGGLMESHNADMTYAAPQAGYQPSDTLTASSNKHGIELIQQSFFMESRNGRIYSKLTVSVDINSTPDGFMNFSFEGVANTNGSRNWEATAPQQ